MSSFTHRPNATPSPQMESIPASTGGPPLVQAAVHYAITPGGPPDAPRFRPQIARSLRMHRALALGVATVVCFALMGLGLRQGKVYQAQSLVYVEPTIPGSVTSQNSAGFDQVRYASYLDQQMQTVTRPDILAAALATLPAGTWRQPNESVQAAVARLQKALVVERLLTGYDISIKLTTPNAEESAAIVNAVTTAYLKGGRKDELTQAGGREQILDEERQRVSDELAGDQKEQAALGMNLGVANPAGEGGNPFDLQLINLRAQLAAAREAHDVAAAQLSSVSGSEADQQSGLAAVADEAINTDQGLVSLKSSINARRAILESEMAGLTPNNPRYKQDQQEIADLERSLDAMTTKTRGLAERRIQDKLRVELQRTAAVEDQLNAQLAQETAKATGAGPKLQRASELAADIQRLRSRFTEVDGALRAVQLETNGPGMAHLALAASVPASPESSHRDLYFLVALPFGILCGIAAAVLARVIDKRVFLGADLERVLGFAPMAVFPARADVPSSVLDECVLRLAAAVEGAYRTASTRTFIVTAVSAGTDIRLLLQALSKKLEELRLKVLILNAAELLVPSKETAEHHMQILSEAGGGDRLLRYVPAGEGIAAAKFERLKAENDIILVDAAPLLQSAATEYIARSSDATILIAESGVTLSTELAEAALLLSRLHVKGVGAVLEGLRLLDADEAFKKAISAIEQRSPETMIERQPDKRDGQRSPTETPYPVEITPQPVAEPVSVAQMVTEDPIVVASFAPPPIEWAAIDPTFLQPQAVVQREIVPILHNAEPDLVKQHEPDLVTAAPSYARSKIRLAFMAQEVGSKTTRFSNLFRDDHASASNATLHDGHAETISDTVRSFERLPEVTGPQEPELEHLLNRISSGMRKAYRDAPNPSPVPPPVDSLSLVPERQSSVANVFASSPDSKLTIPRSPLSLIGEEPEPHRPLRPLSFQQLAGEHAHDGTAETKSDFHERPTAQAPPDASFTKPLVSLASSESSEWPVKSSMAPESEPVQPKSTPAPNTPTVQVVTEIPNLTPLDVEALDSDVVLPTLIEQLVPEISSLGTRPSEEANDGVLRPASTADAPVMEKPLRSLKTSDLSGIRRSVSASAPRSSSRLQPIPLLRSGAMPRLGAPSEPKPRFVSLTRAEENGHRSAEALSSSRPLYQTAETPAIRGLSRRWALLSNYDPSITDPLPAARGAKPRFVESTLPKSNKV